MIDPEVLNRTATRFRKAGIVLPTIAQLKNPSTISVAVRDKLRTIDPDAPDPLNLFRVHWFNDATRKGFADVPDFVELPDQVTGVKARIVMLLGNRFPMIRAHKVLAAYGCLIPQIASGGFDPTRHRAVWPSTGNFCRGGVAISRILGCRGVAVLPENMSSERFEWLAKWVVDPADVIRTPGSESNVKEIYDTCAVLDRDPINIIFNQFCEFRKLSHSPNLHRDRDGASVRSYCRTRHSNARLAAYVSASGSAGTLAAGDHLKQKFGTKIVAVEALECPTLLCNGFGEHNIQGIGDKHIPYIHNVMNTDLVAAVSDRATDTLFVLFNTEQGREYLIERRGLDGELVSKFRNFGLSSLCNMLAAIKIAKYYDLGSEDLILSVATDGAELYESEIAKATARYFGNRFDWSRRARPWGRSLAATTTDNMIELNHIDRKRIFNLGYFTWVEQQGVSLEEFQVRLNNRTGMG